MVQSRSTAGDRGVMNIEDYVEETPEGGLRVKGTRIGLDLIVDAYHRGLSADQIVHNYYPALTLEQVYSAFTYYLHHREAVDAYCDRLDAEEDRAVAAQEANPPELIKRIRELKRRREAA